MDLACFNLLDSCVAVISMRGLSLSYKESIDQVWQAAAVSGFFVVMRLNLILEEMIMEWNFLFFMNSVLLGVGLAMDAFSVSLANGMNEKNMKKSRMAYIAGVYAFFQFLMPMIGFTDRGSGNVCDM